MVAMNCGLFYHDELLRNVNALRLELYECAEVSFVCHGQNLNFFNRLFCVLESDGKSYLEQVSSGKRLMMRAGSIYFVSAADELRFLFELGTRFFSFHFNVFSASAEEMFFGTGLLLEESGNELFLQEIVQAFAKPNIQEGAALLKSLLLQKISHFLSERGESSESVFSLSPALHLFLRNQANAQTTLAELAEIDGVSVDTLSRRFSSQNHFTLKSFLNHSIAARAECLLRNPALKIKDVAKLLGFSNEYYFSRFFKRETRQTPLEYRSNSCRKN